MLPHFINSLLYTTLAVSVVLATQVNHHSGRNAEAPAQSTSEEEKLEVGSAVSNAMRIASTSHPSVLEKTYDGSNAGSAQRPLISLTPPVRWTSILVYDSNGLSGDHLGYLGEDLTPYDDYYVTSDCNYAMKSPQVLSGALINPKKQKGYSNVGFRAQSPDLTTVDSNFAVMTATTGTPGSLPVQQSSGFGPVWIESNVWSLGPNNELIPTWVNPDGTEVPTKLAYEPAVYEGIMMVTTSAFVHPPPEPISWTPIRLFLADLFTPCS